MSYGCSRSEQPKPETTKSRKKYKSNFDYMPWSGPTAIQLLP
jgi:hypothetical protein